MDAPIKTIFGKGAFLGIRGLQYTSVYSIQDTSVIYLARVPSAIFQ